MMHISARTEFPVAGANRNLDLSLDLNTTLSHPMTTRSSLAAVSQTSSRQNRQQTPYTVKRVCANFSMDNVNGSKPQEVKLWKRKPDRMGFELTSMDTQSQMESITAGRTQKLTPKGAVELQSRSKTKTHYLPSMLLPTAKAQMCGESFADFVNGLRRNTVIPHTQTAPLMIASNQLNNTSHSLDSLRGIPSSATTFRKQIHSVPSSLHLNESIIEPDEQKENIFTEAERTIERTGSTFSISSISSLSSGDVTPLEVPPPSFIEHPQSPNKQYLDNFADGSVANFRWAMLRTRIMAKEKRKEKQRREKMAVEHGDDIECPVCAEAAKKFGEGKEFLKWLLDRWKPASRSPLDAPEQNTLCTTHQQSTHLGHPKVQPHFCNFVRKARFSEKGDNATPTPDHANTRSANANARRPSASSVSAVTSSRKRPSSAWSAVDRVGEENSNMGDQSQFTDGASTTEEWPTDVVEHAWEPDSHHLDEVINANTDPAPPPFPDTNPSPSSPRDLDVTSVSSVTSRGGHMTPGSPTPSAHSHGSNATCRADIRIPTPRPESPVDRTGEGDGADNTNGNADDDVFKEDGDKAKEKKVVLVPDLPDFKHFPTKPHQGPDQHVNQPSENEKQRKKREIVKKERKSIIRERSQRPSEETMEENIAVPEPEPVPEPEKEVKPVVVPEPPKPRVVEAPALPSAKKELEAKKNRMNRRSGRMAVPIEIPAERKKVEQTEAQVEARKAFELNLPDMATEEVVVPKPRVAPWLHGRLALSQQASRFQLPMDIKQLEKISACEYLRQYCVITSRRHTLYQKIHSRYRDHKTGKISTKDLEKALKDVLINSITSDDVTRICKVVGLKEEEGVEYKLFAGIASVAERMLYPKFLTEDTADIAEFKKEMIEHADFNCLDWKLHGLNVNPNIRNIFEVL